MEITYQYTRQNDLPLEVQEHINKSLSKSPSGARLCEFFIKGATGLNPGITEKDIDDGIDCMLENRKACIAASQRVGRITEAQKEQLFNQSDIEFEIFKNLIKSSFFHK